MKTTLLIPTLNEIDGMQVIMPRIDPDWVDQIIILDGGSTDGTIEYAEEHGYFVHVQEEWGFRKGYTEALQYVDGDILITFSPDGNSIPELLPDLIAKMQEDYDMVIVSRYLDGARSEDDDPITAFGNWLFTRTVNRLFRASYTDVMVMYRAYKIQVIYDLELTVDRWYEGFEKLFRTRVGWEPLLSARAAIRKLRTTEIPGDEPARIGGERKLKVFKWGAIFLLQFWRDFFLWR